METMVDDQGTVVVSQSSSNSANVETGVSSSQSESINTNQVVTATAGQTIAVPTIGGQVSIVHVALPNQQPVHLQSVIQANQQSVIQTTGGTSTLQAVQLSKGNVILLNKGGGSVIQTATGQQLQAVQIMSEEEQNAIIAEEDSKKRREILARRPSYRKILNELSSAESPTISSDVKDDCEDDDDDSESGRTDNESTNTITVAGVTVLPAGSIQIATGSQGEGIQGLQTLTMTNAGATGQIVQYAQGSDGQFFVPVTVSAADLRAYQLAGSGATATAIQQGVVVTPATSIQSPQQMAEEASRKRELRLLKNRCKNREAARECRRKKKEYIKCLENRVAVLENQNKALIEELKALKELYCSKTD